MSDTRRAHSPKPEAGERSPPPTDEPRLAMMRRVKLMTIEERLDLFEQLSRDAAWARRAKRVR